MHAVDTNIEQTVALVALAESSTAARKLSFLLNHEMITKQLKNITIRNCLKWEMPMSTYLLTL